MTLFHVIASLRSNPEKTDIKRVTNCVLILNQVQHFQDLPQSPECK